MLEFTAGRAGCLIVIGAVCYSTLILLTRRSFLRELRETWRAPT